MNLEELTKKVKDLEKRIEKIEQNSLLNTNNLVQSVQKEKQQSIVEFLKEKKPITAIDKTLVIAVYFEICNPSSESFGTEDILGLWRQAKEKKPTNINDLINKNVQKSFIAEESKKEKGKKRWYVTSTGFDIVNKGFAQE